VLKDFIRDSLYTRHTSNFRVLCPNKILGIGQRRSELPIDEARDLATIWGNNPVHPSRAAYEKIASGIIADIANSVARYTNPPRQATQQSKKPRLDLSLERDTWVSGCTAALPRRDTARHSVRCGGSKGTAPVRGQQGARHPRGGHRGGRGARARGARGWSSGGRRY
jgi:hypothetical protein